MTHVPVREEEIEAAERLRGQGDFSIALGLTQGMLSRASDVETRMRLLFDVLYCSTELGEDAITAEAIREIERLPKPEISRLFVDFIQAMSLIAHGRAHEGLKLIEDNLKSKLMGRDDFRIWKYKHLAYKGSALIWLGRPTEALALLAEAHEMYPDGERETEILIDQANCLLGLDRYEDAYCAASRVLSRGNEELATLALQYMAESRMWERRIQEALAIYNDILTRLPCRLVNEERIRAGIRKGMTYLAKDRPQGKPS
jgi:tetratricopeptide (TPR) repeat protein